MSGKYGFGFETSAMGGAITPSNIGDYAWLLNGNTVGSLKFIGTLDAYSFPFRVNNSEVARFIYSATASLNGNFGINTTSPTAKLHIKGYDSTTNYYAIKVDDSADNSLFCVKNNGRIGIGILNPGTKLQVVGEGNSSTTYNFQTSNLSSSKYAVFRDDGLFGINCIPTATLDIEDDKSDPYILKLANLGSTRTAAFTIRTQSANITHIYNVGSAYVGISTDYRQSTVYGTENLNSNSRGINFIVDNSGTSTNQAFRIIGDDATYSGGFAGTFFYAKDGQVGIGLGSSAPNNSALLELSSTTKGLLIMRMTSTQASAITGVDGLMLYVTDTDATFTSVGFWGYQGGAWAKF